jgi:hypothetical protein
VTRRRNVKHSHRHFHPTPGQPASESQLFKFTFEATTFVQPSSPLMSRRKKCHIQNIPQIFRSISKSAKQDWEIRCIIQNECVTFSVKLSRNYHINELKSLVIEQACHGVLRNVNSKDLVLYKVSAIFRSGNNASTNVLCLIRWISTSMVVPGNPLHI